MVFSTRMVTQVLMLPTQCSTSRNNRPPVSHLYPMCALTKHRQGSLPLITAVRLTPVRVCTTRYAPTRGKAASIQNHPLCPTIGCCHRYFFFYLLSRLRKVIICLRYLYIYNLLQRRIFSVMTLHTTPKRPTSRMPCVTTAVFGLSYLIIKISSAIITIQDLVLLTLHQVSMSSDVMQLVMFLLPMFLEVWQLV